MPTSGSLIPWMGRKAGGAGRAGRAAEAGRKKGSRRWWNEPVATSQPGCPSYEQAEPPRVAWLSRVPREAAPAVAQHGAGLRAGSSRLRGVLCPALWDPVELAE